MAMTWTTTQTLLATIMMIQTKRNCACALVSSAEMTGVRSAAILIAKMTSVTAA